MTTLSPSTLLRRVLLIDAVCSGGLGLLMLLFASALASLLSLPVELLSDAALVLIPFAAFVGYLAARAEPPRIGVWAVIAANVIWTIDSLVLLFAGWVAPNALGYVFVVGQAVIVGVFAELEYLGLRKLAFASSVQH